MDTTDNPLPWDSPVGDVATSIRDAIIDTVGASLVGLYVYGSLIGGDFDPDVSDIDFVAVLTNDPSDELGGALKEMHDALARNHPQWAGRIEVVYVCAGRLKTYREGIPRMAVISPGEPFHIIEGGQDWILTWYPAREEAVALIGPPISAFIPEIAQTEFVDAVRKHIHNFGQRIKDDHPRGVHAYAVITVCRGIYTLVVGTRPSKGKAAAWAAKEFPHWSGLIESALAWRKEQYISSDIDRTAASETRRFVAEMTQLLS